MSADVVFPGDVLLVRDRRIYAWFIRMGAALRDQPDIWNHVIVVSHTDEAGVQWGIEATPGGVGWVALTSWLADRWTIDNAGQPKTEQQRDAVVQVAKGLLGTPYDWTGIIVDAMEAINVRRLWKLRSFGAQPPAHVVCSSLAAWIYAHVGLAHPGVAQRTTTPADWASFILRREWA